MSQRRVLLAILAVATVAGIVLLQAVDDAESRTPITASTTTSTRPATGKLLRADLSAATCTTLLSVVPEVARAIAGDDAQTSERRGELTRELRSVARRERLPAPLRVAVRRLARFFESSSEGVEVLALGETLGKVVPAMFTVSQYAASECTSTTTSSTTRPLR
jgi:hypothetical protein